MLYCRFNHRMTKNAANRDVQNQVKNAPAQNAVRHVTKGKIALYRHSASSFARAWDSCPMAEDLFSAPPGILTWFPHVDYERR